MSLMVAFCTVLATLAIGDVISTRTKAFIPSVFVSALIFLFGFWTFFPSNIVELAGFPMPVVVLSMLLLISHMGTMLSIKELISQWKTIVTALSGIVGICLATMTIGQFLFGWEKVVAATPPLTGGIVAAIVMSDVATQKGLADLAVLAIIMYVMQGFVGYPLTAINVKDKNTNPHNNSNYDIVLVCVLVGKLYNSNEHLGIGSIASVLRKSGYSVKVLYIHESEVDEYITGEILYNNPKIIGFNTYAITILKVTNIATLIKSKDSSVKIFLGGPTATFEDREILSKCEAVDFIIRGEGEFTVVEAVDAVFKNLSFDNIKGLSYKAKDNIIVNPNRKSIDDLDALPWPDRDFCEGKKPDYLIIETARGCLGRCSFCSAANKSLYGGKVWRGRSVKNVIDEIEHLVKTYDVRAFNIIDASFEDPGMKGKKRIESFAKEIIDRNLEITYMAHFRSENIKEKDNYLLDLLIQSGLERVSLGLESGYSLGLKVFNKRATVEDNEEIVKILRNKHLALVSGFIMFQPYSSIEELRENTNFLRKTGFACRFENFEQHIEIYPGTPLKETMIKDGLITDKHDFTYRNYEYEYVDGRILPLARAMGNIANEYNIEFELFDLSMQIFCLRVRKKLSSQDEINELNKFERELDKMREELSGNICDFFLNQVDDIEKGRWKEENFRNLIDGGIVKPTIHTKHKIRKLQKNYMKDLLSKSNFDFKKI